MKDKLISIAIFAYLLFVCLYNLYGASFSVEVNNLLKQVYFLVTSVCFMALSWYLIFHTFDYCLLVFSTTLFIHSLFMTAFNIACVIRAEKAASFIYSEVLSGVSIFIIFVIIIIFYGRLDKRK